VKLALVEAFFSLTDLSCFSVIGRMRREASHPSYTLPGSLVPALKCWIIAPLCYGRSAFLRLLIKLGIFIERVFDLGVTR